VAAALLASRAKAADSFTIRATFKYQKLKKQKGT
jgi:hypothetical protein